MSKLVYTVTVEGPDGETKTVEILSAQVNLMKGENNDDPYQTAAWLAYCDLWMQS